MIWLRATLFHMSFWCWTVTLGALALPTLLIPSLARRVAHCWVCGSLWLLAQICGLKLDVQGWEHVPAKPCIVASKHQSTLDTLALWLLLNGPAFILKRQLLWLPVFGWYLACTRPIAILRAAGARMLPKIVAQGKDRLAQGRYIVIFPEGTRTRPGASSRYRMAGVSVLYEALNVPVVPVALNTGIFWPRRAFTKRQGEAVIRFMPAIAPGLTSEAMTAQLQATIERESASLLDRA